MLVNVSTEKLSEVMDLASKFVSKHSTLPVLENVYIKGSIDTLVFRATDMEKYIDIEIPAQVENEGSITINAKTFGDIIKTIDSEEVKLSINESTETLTVKTESDDFNIKWIPSSEYVAVPETNADQKIDIDASLFSKGVEKVESAVTERNFSPALTGILMRMKKYDEWNKLVFVWTDSFRLAEYKVDFNGDFKEKDIIVPKLNVVDVKKVVDYFSSKWGDLVKVWFSDNLVSFDLELEDMKIYITSILIQWDFPEYENESIIPSNFITNVVMDKNSMENAIKKISIFTRDMNNFIDMSIQEWTIKTKSWETDKGEWNTFVKWTVTGEDVDIWVNGRFLLDFIKVIESDVININIVNSEKPMVLFDNENKDYRYIVRPLANK